MTLIWVQRGATVSSPLPMQRSRTACGCANASSADLRVCCIAGFQPAVVLRNGCRFGDRRYSRLGGLRYIITTRPLLRRYSTALHVVREHYAIFTARRFVGNSHPIERPINEEQRDEK